MLSVLEDNAVYLLRERKISDLWLMTDLFLEKTVRVEVHSGEQIEVLVELRNWMKEISTKINVGRHKANTKQNSTWGLAVISTVSRLYCESKSSV